MLSSLYLGTNLLILMSLTTSLTVYFVEKQWIEHALSEVVCTSNSASGCWYWKKLRGRRWRWTINVKRLQHYSSTSQWQDHHLTLVMDSHSAPVHLNIIISLIHQFVCSVTSTCSVTYTQLYSYSDDVTLSLCNNTPCHSWHTACRWQTLQH